MFFAPWNVLNFNREKQNGVLDHAFVEINEYLICKTDKSKLDYFMQNETN